MKIGAPQSAPIYFKQCGKKIKEVSPRLTSFILLRNRLGLCDNLNTLVVAASLAYTVSKIVLAALGALNEVGRSLELPNARASLHLSGMRNLSLRNCHF